MSVPVLHDKAGQTRGGTASKMSSAESIGNYTFNIKPASRAHITGSAGRGGTGGAGHQKYRSGAILTGTRIDVGIYRFRSSNE